MRLKSGFGIAAILLAAASLHADVVLWAMDAKGSNSNIEQWDATTGSLLTSFVLPNPAAQGHTGRGIAVVGSNIFYSVDSSGTVFSTNPSGTDLGTAFNTGLPGIGSIASDGQFLYLAPTNSTTSGNETVLKYTFGGTLINTITMVPSNGPEEGTVGRTGLEIVGNNFVANQGDNEGPYDKFDSAGNLLTAAFLNPGEFSFTGVAFDGSIYYVADEEAQPSVLRLFNASGGSLGLVTLTGCPGPNQQCDLQDLSVVVSLVPEPSAFALLASVLLCLGILAARRKLVR
jgi:hypothetical protein